MHTSEGKWERYQHVQDCLNAVLEIQEEHQKSLIRIYENRTNKNDDDDSNNKYEKVIAEACSSVTVSSVRIAQEIAKKLRIDIMVDYAKQQQIKNADHATIISNKEEKGGQPQTSAAIPTTKITETEIDKEGLNPFL